MIHSYPWYIADWRGSEAVMAMNLEQRGLYRELLDQCWSEGSLPTTTELLIVIARVSMPEWKRSWPTVKKEFVERDGRFWHPKVDSKRAELVAWHDSRREAGKKGAVKRWHSSAIAEPVAEPMGTQWQASWPSSTTSSTTSSTKEETPPTPSQLLLATIASEIHTRHPHRRRDCSVAMVEKQLRAILKHKHILNGHAEEYLTAINRNHDAACQSPDWRKDGGEYAKGLQNWLAPTVERYDQQAEVQPEQPRLML